MPNLGMSELIVILMILLLVFGGSRLPQIGESLGRTARNFKRGFAGNDDIKVEPAAAAPSAPQKLESPAKSATTSSTKEVDDAELIEKKG